MTVRATKDCIPFNYLEIENFPARDPYGFRFAPSNDRTAQRELLSWAEQSREPGHRMDGGIVRIGNENRAGVRLRRDAPASGL
jgi:hypothetical protein